MAELGSFSLDDLKEVMRACAGVDEAIDLNGDIGELTFEDLGYDSLAVLEMAAKLQNDLNVAIPGDVAASTLTPNSVIEYIKTGSGNVKGRPPVTIRKST